MDTRHANHTMSIEITNDSGAKARFEEIGAEPPDGLTIMPAGLQEFDSEQFIVYPDGTDTVRKLLEQSDVSYTPSDVEEDAPTLVLRSEEIVLPTLYIACKFVQANWDQIEFALDKLAEFYQDRYNQDIEMTVEQETENGNTTRIEYRGPPDGIDSLSDEIAALVGMEDEDE